MFYPLSIILVITVVIILLVITVIIIITVIHLLEGIMSTLAITSLHNPRFLISGITKKPHRRHDEALMGDSCIDDSFRLVLLIYQGLRCALHTSNRPNLA